MIHLDRSQGHHHHLIVSGWRMFHNPAYNCCIPADRFHSKKKEVKKKNERYDVVIYTLRLAWV